MIDTIRAVNVRPDAGQEAENAMIQQEAHPVSTQETGDFMRKARLLLNSIREPPSRFSLAATVAHKIHHPFT